AGEGGPAAWGEGIGGCRRSFDSTRVPTRRRVVTAAAAARALNGASCWPNAPAEKWSRSSREPTPASSAARAWSAHAGPFRTDSATIPNRTALVSGPSPPWRADALLVVAGGRVRIPLPLDGQLVLVVFAPDLGPRLLVGIAFGDIGLGRRVGRRRHLVRIEVIKSCFYPLLLGQAG